MRKLIIALALMAMIVSPALADRSIDGSTVTVTPLEAENGIATLCFEVWNGSADYEYLVDVIITLPDCMTILDDPAPTATPEEGVNFAEVPVFSGFGTNVATWHGGDVGFGFMIGLSYATFCVTVDIACDCDVDYTVGWQLIGDGYGGEPHEVTGDLLFGVICSTSAQSTNWSNVKSLY
jgi:hypothetical protein